MLDLHRLMLLHQFALRGTITATASTLGYSPSAVSQQLSALEHETGLSLLDRTARTAVLTDAGRFLAERAGGLLGHAESIESELAAYGTGVRGTLAVSAIPTTASAVAIALAAVADAHPELETSLRQVGSQDAPHALFSGDVDVAVIDTWSGPSTPDGLVGATLGRDPLSLAVPPDHALATGRTPVALRSVREQARHSTWLCAPEGEPSRTATDAMLRSAGIDATRLWEFEGLDTIAALVAQGAGIAVLPDLVLRDTAVHARPLRPARVRTLRALTRRSATRRPAVKAAIAALRAAFA